MSFDEEEKGLLVLTQKLINRISTWIELLNKLESIVYFSTGRILFFKDKIRAYDYLKKVKDTCEEYYSARLILNLADEKLFEYCKDIGFEDTFLKVLQASFNHNNSFKDYSLPNELNRVDKKNKVLIYLLNFYVHNILDKLIVRFDDHERKVAHYTSLFGFDKLIVESKPLRLNSADLMNDPSEGQLIFPYLGISNETNDNTFLSCFTFNHNSLNQFRLYGRTNNKEGTGISLVLDKTYFSNTANGFIFDKLIESPLKKDRVDDGFTEYLPLFRCVYIDTKTGFIDVAKRNKTSFYQEYATHDLSIDEIKAHWVEYESSINSINKNVYEDLQKISEIVSLLNKNKKDDKTLERIIKKTLRPLRFVFKHLAFQEEQECRVFYVTTLSDTKVNIPNNEQRVIYEYGADIKDSLNNIYIGPALSEKFTYIRKVLIDTEVKIQVCDSPFFNQ